MEEKFCTKCKTTQPIENFYKPKNRNRISKCTDCSNKYKLEWSNRNRERKKLNERKSYYLKTEDQRRGARYFKRYRLTLDEYNEILRKQKGVCAICYGLCTKQKHLSVDHCHETNEVRGLLCNACNNLLGRAKDDPDILRNAADYLE